MPVNAFSKILQVGGSLFDLVRFERFHTGQRVADRGAAGEADGAGR
jgi:hypothetical protein